MFQGINNMSFEQNLIYLGILELTLVVFLLEGNLFLKYTKIFEI